MKDDTETQAEMELITRTAKGDKESFRQLYERYSGVIFSTAYRILNDQQAAEDVAQDVFIQIWDKADTYDAKRGKPLTWTMTLTKNKAIDRLRSKQRRIRLRDEFEQESKTRASKVEDTAVTKLDLAEKSKVVRSALLKLSPAQREAIELAFFSGMSQSEIAKELREPLGTVKARIRRGMMNLKGIIPPKL
jgi:RNA polymerase sigma-70 factor (ECF subfamily)